MSASKMAVILTNKSLDEVERLYRAGYVSREAVLEYLKVWNAGPHFTQAVLFDGAIRNFDPERSTYPMDIEQACGVRRAGALEGYADRRARQGA